MYLANGGNHVIMKYDPATNNVTVFAGKVNYGGLVDGIGTSAAFNNPTMLSVDNSGNLFVIDVVSCLLLQLGGYISICISSGSFIW